MFNLMPRRRESKTEGALARREHTPSDLLRHEFASPFGRAFPEWPFEAMWEWESEGRAMEERDDEVVIRAEVPGFEPNELEVSVRGNELILHAEHAEPTEGKAVERRHARLERRLTLPPGLDPDKIEARYRNGILEVHVPRVPEAKPRRIEVKT